MEKECSFVRDVLPLYVENMVSEDTAAFVKEHLESCAACHAEFESMKHSNDLEKICDPGSLEQVDEVAPLKALKKKMRHRKIATIVLSAVFAVAVVCSIFFVLVIWGLPTSSDKIELKTEFQYNDSAYLDQSFALHILRLDGMPLNVGVKNVYETDEYGKKILVGYEIIPKVVVLNLGQHVGSYTIGYGIDDALQIHYQRMLRSVMHGFFEHESSGGFSDLSIDKDASYRFSIEGIVALLNLNLGENVNESR